MTPYMYIFLVVVIATIYCGIIFFDFYAQSSLHHLVTPLDEGWTYHSADGQTVEMETLQRSISFEPNTNVFFSRTLSAMSADSGLFLAAREQNVRVYLDGAFIFSYRDSPAGFVNLFIPLPPDSAGRELKLEISSPYQAYAISPRTVLLGQMEALQIYIWSNSLLRMVIMLFSVLTGLIFIVLAFWKHITSVMEIHWPMFAFGVASIIWGISVYSYDLAMPEILPAVLASDVNVLTNILYLPPFLYFVYLQITVYRKWVRWLVYPFTAFVLVVLVISMTGYKRAPDLLPIVTPVLLFASVAIIAVVLIEWMNRNRLAKFILVPMIPILVTIGSMIYSTLNNFLLLEKIRALSIFFLVIMIWVYQIRTYFMQRSREKNEMEVIRIKGDLVMKQEAVISAYYQKTAMIRHELCHCVASVHLLAKQGDVASIIALAKKMSAQLEMESVMVFCQNVVVNSILTHVASMAHQQSTGFDCKITTPQHINLPDEECVSLLLNILENALEANEKVPLGNRWISFSMDAKENLLMLSCQNAKADRLRKSRTGELLTTKEEKGPHGFGIKVIKEIVDRYDGEMDITEKEDSFAIKILLVLPKAEAGASVQDGDRFIA